MYSGQYFGGKKRFYYSAGPEGTFNTAVSRDRVLNPIDGSELVGPPHYELLDNANSAQGQGEWATKLWKGAEDHQGSPTFHLTPEAFGKFFASALGEDTKDNTVDTSSCVEHALSLDTGETASPFTIEEHINGGDDTTNSWIFSGSYVHAVTINVNRGNQFATISPHIVASKYVGPGIDQIDADLDDDTDQWPSVIGVPPTMCWLYFAPTANSNHDSTFDGAFGAFTTAGACGTDIGVTGFNAALLAPSWSLTYATGVDLNESYRAGTAAGSGFVRGQPYTCARACALTFNFETTSASDAFLTYFKDWADVTPLSWTMQFSFASDVKVGTTYYGGGSFVCNAMRIRGKPGVDGTVGPATGSVTFEGMQAGSGGETAFVEAISWDGIDVDYA